jgi:opacity protein-like surface antigen
MKMLFYRTRSGLRKILFLLAAIALPVCSASAQFANPHDTSGSVAITANESSSNDMKFVDPDGVLTEPALPAEPGANGAGGGQYDNRPARESLYSRLAFEAGGGFNSPAPDSPDITWGGNVTLGAGYRFNPMFSTLVEYQFISNKLPGTLIAQAGSDGGNAHIWSFTVAPVVDLFPKGRFDAYITGGGGFYRKVTNFTNPQSYIYCNYFYCGIYTQDVVIGHFSSNQGGWNIGGGIAHRFGGNMKIFAEARYLDVLTPAVTTEPNGLGTTTVEAGTRLLPVTIGVRW